MKKLYYLFIMLLFVVMFYGVEGVKANTSATIASGATNSVVTISRSVTGATSPVTSTFTYTITKVSGPGTVGSFPPSASPQIVMSSQALSGTTATKTTTVSLVGATFSKPGDYIFTVVEASSSNSTTYPKDTSNSYTIKVQVRNHAENDFASPMDATIQLFSGTGSSATKLADNASLAFTSAASYKTITLTKTIEGTMADTDDSFPFTITIKGGSVGDVYSISGGTSATGCTVPSGSTSCDLAVSLKHGQTATITGVRDGQTYTFSETANSTTNKYQTFINGSTTNDKSLASDRTVGSSNSNTVVNKWNQAVVTGLMIRFLPYVLVISAAIAGIAFIAIRNSRRAREESIEL